MSAEAFGDFGQHVAGEMDPAALPRLRLVTLRRTALVSPSWASEMTRRTPPRPRLRSERKNSAQKRLGLAVADRQAEHLAVAGRGDPGGHHDGLGHHLVQVRVADLQVGGVQEHVRELDVAQRSVLERARPARRGARQIRDTSLREIPDAIPIAWTRSSTLRVEMPSTYAWAITAYKRLVDTPARLEQAREETTGPQLGDLQLDIAGLGGQQPAPVPVAFGARGPRCARSASGADHLGRLGLDQLLEDQADRFADQVEAVTGTEHLEQLGQDRIIKGHRRLLSVRSWRNTPRITPMAHPMVDPQLPQSPPLGGTPPWARADGEELVVVHVGKRGASEVARHRLSTPGHPMIDDAHYPPRPPGALARRPKAANEAEAAFLALGEGARTWLVEAAAAGTSRIRLKMSEALTLSRLHGAERVDWALGHAAIYHRFGDGDLVAILSAPANDKAQRANEHHSLQVGTGAWEGFGR